MVTKTLCYQEIASAREVPSAGGVGAVVHVGERGEQIINNRRTVITHSTSIFPIRHQKDFLFFLEARIVCCQYYPQIVVRPALHYGPSKPPSALPFSSTVFHSQSSIDYNFCTVGQAEPVMKYFIFLARENRTTN